MMISPVCFTVPPEQAEERMGYGIDFYRKNDKNRSVINFYSDRKTETGAHNVSSGNITDPNTNIVQK